MGALDGRTAIVTGSSRGIGRAIALRLAAAGARVVLCARSHDALKETAREIGVLGHAASFISLDLRLPDSPAHLVQFTLDAGGRIDIVVNNAGATRRGDFLDLTEEDWTDGFALKFFGAVRLARAAWPHLKASCGSLVNIAGIGGRTPGSEFAVGGSVNAALLSFTKSLAATGIRDGVQVNAVNPGYIRTGRLVRRLAAFASERDFIEHEKIARIGEPEDIAGLVNFVVSPAGRLLHGALIDMDAGATRTM